MRIELRDESRQRIGRITVDPVQRPTRVTVNAARAGSLFQDAQNDAASGLPSTREAFLNWDTALDDSGQLRKCVACGCEHMFKEKAFPQVTAFVVALAFVGAIISALGLATNILVLVLMAVVLLLDIAILVFSRRRLVCYRCRSTYHDLAIARYHRTWDRAVADRHPAETLAIAASPAANLLLATTQAATASSAVAVDDTLPNSPSRKGYFA